MTFSDILAGIKNIGNNIRGVVDPNYIKGFTPDSTPWFQAPAVPQTKGVQTTAPAPKTLTDLSGSAIKTAVAAPVQPTSPQPLGTPAFDANTLKSMIAIYGGADAPLNQYADQLAGATRYQFWKDNPELLALIPHLETSSGRNVTRPNNLTNWGINYPGNNAIFETMTKQQVLDRFISGLGERDKNYTSFRTGSPLTDEQLLEFAKKYEPANGSYGPNLIEGRKHLRTSLGL